MTLGDLAAELKALKRTHKTAAELVKEVRARIADLENELETLRQGEAE